MTEYVAFLCMFEDRACAIIAPYLLKDIDVHSHAVISALENFIDLLQNQKEYFNLHVYIHSD